MNKQKTKKILISVTAVTAAAAIGAGTWLGIRAHGRDPVPVFDFMSVGMTEFWGDTQESYGPVSSDNIQTVFLSKTQEITEVLVKEGDQVKEGDLLMTFDTTLSAIDLERKRLEVEKLKLQLEDEKRELQKINAMRPMQVPTEQPDSDGGNVDLGEELQGFRIYEGDPAKSNGASPETPLICWVRNDAFLTQDLMKVLLWKAAELQVQLNPTDPGTGEHSKPSPGFPAGVLTSLLGEDTTSEGGETGTEGGSGTEGGGTEGGTGDGSGTEGGTGDPQSELVPALPQGNGAEKTVQKDTPVYDQYSENGTAVFRPSENTDQKLIKGQKVKAYQTLQDSAQKSFTLAEYAQDGEENPLYGWVPAEAFDAPAVDPGGNPGGNPGGDTDNGGGENPGGGNQPGGGEVLPPIEVPDILDPIEKPENMNPELPATTAQKCYVVFRVTGENRKFGAHQVWQGIQLNKDGAFRFFDANGVPDYFMTQLPQEEGAMPDFDFGSGLTAGQIAQLREDQKLKIQEAELKAKMADADYKIKKRELDDGNIHAQFDGTVVSLLSEEEARKTQKPMLKVSGGGGFLVEGTVGELDREKMEIGMEVTINDWNSGEMYTGEVISVGDFPVGTSYYGGGNPNSSEYPFKAFVDGSADLQTGSYVSIQYAAGGTEHGIYLENPFLRTENGTSFVYVLGEKNRLEKRIVKTGKSLWGSYTEILSGLTEEDMVAFPYGKNVKPGVKAEPGDISQLYR